MTIKAKEALACIYDPLVKTYEEKQQEKKQKKEEENGRETLPTKSRIVQIVEDREASKAAPSSSMNPETIETSKLHPVEKPIVAKPSGGFPSSKGCFPSLSFNFSFNIQK